MKYLIILLLSAATLAHAQTIQSPDKKFKLVVALSAAGAPTYQLHYQGKPVILPSPLGFTLKGQPALADGFTVTKADSALVDTSWNTTWGEVKTVRNHYRELTLTLHQAATNRAIVIRFRLFNDGLGFRYEFPRQQTLSHFVISDELTGFYLTGNHKTFWIPGDYDTNEYAYYTTNLSDATPPANNAADEIAARWPVANAVQTPLMMKSADGLYLNIHEAALVNYPAMILDVNKSNYQLKAHLVPDIVGNKAYLQTPFNTPWRTIIASNKATDILASKTILNLNEPSQVADVSWIKPMKFVGIWWQMHVGTGTWHYADTSNLRLKETNWARLKPNGKHAANTENTKRYIDFAAKHGITGVLVEGWNIGWEDWFGQWKEEVFDFVTPYPDFNVEELHQYAAARGVKLIMHHETSASVTNYDRRMDEAYRYMKAHGYDAVKTGYVGKIIPRGEHHDSQWTINHFLRVAEKTAQQHIMLDAHEPTRPTGLHRTWPNWMASEAARGNEFNAWSVGNPPEHETILPFTRLMGGPMDYTPGIFKVKMEYYDAKKPFNNVVKTPFQVHTTLVKQLALYVTMYSPLQMAADLPENYEQHLDAFQFIEDVAVDWDDTQVLEAEPGDYVTIARKARGKDDWFVGAITDEQARTATVPLAFLDAGKTYVADLYLDGVKAHWKDNPIDYAISHVRVDSKTVLKLKLAAGGGAAVRLRLATAADGKLKKYVAK